MRVSLSFGSPNTVNAAFGRAHSNRCQPFTTDESNVREAMNFEQPRHTVSRPVSKNLSRRRRVVFCLLAVVSASVNLAQTTATQGGEPPLAPFTFAQICDTQLGFGTVGYEADLESFRQAVRQINEMKPDFVVICGDLVNLPEPKAYADFKSVLAELKVPCHCVAGNHDIGHPLKPSLLADFRTTIGEDRYCFKHKGYTFSIVNTQLWKSPVDPETSRHDKWFTETLHEAKKRDSPVFVVGHHPLFLESADEKEQYFNIPPTRRAKLLDLFTQNGVVAVLSGHTHKLISHTHREIQFLSGETTSKNFDGRPLGFRLWKIDSPSRVTHQFVALKK